MEFRCIKFQRPGYGRNYKNQLLCIKVFIYFNVYGCTFLICDRFVLINVEFLVGIGRIKKSILKVAVIE